MKKVLLLIVLALFIAYDLSAQGDSYFVTGIKVSATADSAAKAREDAINQGYALAYQKLISNMGDLGQATRADVPPLESLMSMVADFSIDQEKNTSVSYTASLSFQFDPAPTNAWISATSAPANLLSQTLDPLGATEGKVTVFIPITGLQDLKNKTGLLQKICHTRNITLQQMTHQGALLTIYTTLPLEKIQAGAQDHNLPIVFQ
ncbi:Putative DUF2066 domain-containing protein [Candidatus Bealeia paramacronuclearis]|uniref:DUF2066 domain-containing protein n=1 Tax=Candidatus Bealeia paramacronuclearis TaxID=1921001 RepID=A0ABZ2C6U8_9PROT|nr:hypothetical protein [Candidatus Bealeia paramacronuclearis]